MKRRNILQCLAILTQGATLVAAATLPFSVVAQDATHTALRLVVPYSAGGTTDYVARLLQKPLSEILNRPVIVENKPGAAGTIGTDLVAKAAPDGNTIVFGNQGPNAIVPSVRKTPYHPLDDLRPLSTVAFMPLMLLVSWETGSTTLKEFVQQARKSEAKWNYGSSGIGSLAHLTGHEFSRAGGLDMVHVPFQGGGPVMRAVIQGDVQGSFVTGLETASLVKSGKLRYLGVASSNRVQTLTDVPAISEEIPGFESTLWFGVFAPKGTSDAIAERLRNAVVQAVERPEFQIYLKERHAEAKTSTPEELTQLIKKDMARWGEVVRKASIPM